MLQRGGQGPCVRNSDSRNFERKVTSFQRLHELMDTHTHTFLKYYLYVLPKPQRSLDGALLVVQHAPDIGLGFTFSKASLALWNSLPMEVSQEPSLLILTYLLKTVLFRQAL